MRWYFYQDVLFLVPIAAVIAIVYCTARNHHPRPVRKDIVLWLVMLVTGIVGASLVMLGLSVVV